MKRSKEIRIGIVVLLAIGGLVYGMNFLKGKNLFGDESSYFAVYDVVDGLKPDSQVLINGFKVGRVANISFVPDGTGNILVEFTIDNHDIAVPVDSKAKIVSMDLLGSRSIAIILGEKKSFVSVGDTLFSEVEASLQDEVNAQVLPLKNKAEELIGSMDSAVTIVKMILNKDMRDNIKTSFESIKRGINKFENTAFRLDTMMIEEKARIHEIFANFQSISGNLKKNNEAITNVITNLSDISDTLAAANLSRTINHAGEALDKMADIMDKISRGEGSAGMLLHDDKLYKNLVRSTEEMDKLIEDMRVNPKRYVHFSVFGRKEKQKDKPKKRKRDDDS